MSEKSAMNRRNSCLVSLLPAMTYGKRPLRSLQFFQSNCMLTQVKFCDYGE